jgi:hypothetical protein
MYAVPASLTVVGLIFYHIAAFGCKTFKTDLFSVFGASDYKIGYFSADSGSGCVHFNNDGLDGAFRFGRFIGIVGSFMIWAIFAAIVAAGFFEYPNPKLYFKIIGICMGVLSFFSLLLLVGLSADGSLKLAGGGALAILSAFIWAGAAASMFFCMNVRVRVPTTQLKTRSNAEPEVLDANTTENADEENAS